VIGRTSWLGTVLAVAACTSTPTDSTESKVTAPVCREVTLGWGSAPTQVGLLPGGDEYLARGPQAIAVGPTGETFVLDSVNARVLAVGATIRVAVDGIAHDAEALTVGADGAIAVYSPLKSTAWIFDRDGAPAGSVAIDRALHQTVGISLGASRQVLVHSAYQETMSAGSPSAPTSLATLLTGKREGAFLFPDGAGVTTHATSSGVELLVVTNAAGRRSSTRAAFPIPGDASAAMLVGVAGTSACMRVEQVAQPSDRVEVTRRAVCMDATNGRVLTDLALAKPELYVPAHELAAGANTIAVLQPTVDHLTVRTCEVSR